MGPQHPFMTNNGMYTHQVQPRTHMKACNFWGFLRFFPAADFVADFLPCAWCPHILIGVLGGQVLPGDPFRQQVGVPGSPSTIWGPLNIPENLVFLKISKPEFQRFENSKCSEICKIVQKTRKHFLRIFRAQISPKKRFRTKNGICTHQVQPRTHMKSRYFCDFFIFS